MLDLRHKCILLIFLFLLKKRYVRVISKITFYFVILISLAKSLIKTNKNRNFLLTTKRKKRQYMSETSRLYELFLYANLKKVELSLNL